jgi:hypothetical protein
MIEILDVRGILEDAIDTLEEENDALLAEVERLESALADRYETIVAATSRWVEHPEDWDRECYCSECVSYLEVGKSDE